MGWAWHATVCFIILAQKALFCAPHSCQLSGLQKCRAPDFWHIIINMPWYCQRCGYVLNFEKKCTLPILSISWTLSLGTWLMLKKCTLPILSISWTLSLGTWLMLKNQDVDPVPVQTVTPELFCL